MCNQSRNMEIPQQFLSIEKEATLLNLILNSINYQPTAKSVACHLNSRSTIRSIYDSLQAGECRHRKTNPCLQHNNVFRV